MDSARRGRDKLLTCFNPFKIVSNNRTLKLSTTQLELIVLMSKMIHALALDFTLNVFARSEL